MFLKCCCRECIVYEDSFAADSITGGSWSEEAGSWSISAGVLSTADADALLLATTPHPGGDGFPQVLRTDVRFTDALDRARFILAYDSASDYLVGELWIEDGCGHVQFYERVAGVTTAVGAEFTVPFDMALNAWHTVILCFTLGTYPAADQLTMKVRSADGNYWTGGVDVAPGVAGDQSALATGTPVDGTIEFGGFFQYSRNYEPTYYPNCPRCDVDTNCQLHYDEFTRADADSPGCAWTEVAGDWDIDTNELTVAAANAVLLNNNLHPASLAEVSIDVAFRADTGAVLKVILDAEGVDDYLYVKLEPGTECGAVSFWRRAAGAETQIGDDSLLKGLIADPGEMQFINVCLKDGLLRVMNVGSFGNVAPIHSPGSTHSVGEVVQVAAEPQVGLGTGAAAQIWIDKFRVQRMDDSNGANCATCIPQNCVLFEGTTLNCYWVTEAGTWANVTGPELSDLEASTSNAMLLNQMGHPLTTGEGFVDFTSAAEVGVLSYNFGDIVRLLIGVEDDQNYLYAEWEWATDDESTGFLRVGKVEAGVDTEIAEAASSITGGQPNNGEEALSVLRVCYDGLGIRASFERSGFGSEFTTVEGTAGLDWNPGGSGLATGTITGSVYFKSFRFYHDIFGGSPNCAPCYGLSICGMCRTVDDEGNETDLTPPVVLVQIQALAPDTETGCPDAGQFNDTFALPFYDWSVAPTNTCTWRLRPHFCENPDPDDGQFPQIIFGFERNNSGIPGGTFGIRPFVSITAFNYEAGPSPGYVSKSVSWYIGTTYPPVVPAIPGSDLPGYEYRDGANNDSFDCASWLANWLDLTALIPAANIGGAPSFPGGHWLAPFGYSEIATARAKVLI